MARIITVKGIGKASAKPDYVEIFDFIKAFLRALDVQWTSVQRGPERSVDPVARV
ncbi:MAG: hypothetical protein LUG99_06545 [Lachnospiraceae bacterium]|nr:hypothetical protein [Lachnospiraceae bacterium]